MKKLPYNITNKYTGIKFNPEGISKEAGFNCLSLALDFCKEELDLDYEFNKNIIGDIDWKSVVQLFKDNPREVFNKLEKHFLNYVEKIPLHQMRKGDTLSVDFGDGRKIPCVFVGNNKILLTTDKGVKVLSLKGKTVHDVYRIKEPKKIITKAVYEMGENSDDLELVDEESYLHNGDIAECEAATWIGIIALIISLIMSIWTYYNQPEAPDDPTPQGQHGVKLNTRSTQEPLKGVYGLQRVGGNDVYIATMGYHSRYLYIIQTLSEGEVDSIHQVDSVDQILIDDKPYTDFGSTVSYQFYSGSDSQTHDTVLNTADPNWTENQRYTSYIRWRFTWDENLYRGVPNRILDLKGKKVLDFRDDTTAWSDNAILCLYDFFTNNRCGLGVDSANIDGTSWTTAANYFDTKDWSFNYITQNNHNPWAVVQDMLKHFRGAVSWFDGKYYLLIADINEESSVMTITDSHIVQDSSGRAQIRIVQPSRFNKPKGVRVTFRDKEKEYVRDDVLVGDETGVVESMSLMGYTDRETVGNLATYQLERLKLNRTISGVFRDDCLELAPHDLVTFNSTALAISDQAMRVVSTSFADNGLISLTLQHESEELYDDDYDADIENVYTCDLPDPNTVVIITNPQISEDTFYYRLRTESRLHITFTIPDTEPWFKHVEIWQAIVDGGDPVPDEADYEHQYNTTNDFHIDHVEQGQVYYIVLISVSIYGVKDTFSNAPKVSHLVGGNSDAPQSLAFLSAIPSTMGLTLFSDKLDDPDIESYEFRLGPQWVGALFISAKRSPQEAFPGIKPGTHTFFCNTKGTNGMYGVTPRSAVAIIQLPIGWTLSDTFTDDYDGTALPNDITGITSANPGVASSIAHTLVIGDKVAFANLTEMTELNGTTQVVTAVGSADTFSINDTSGYAAETTGGACGTEVGTHDNTEHTTYAAEDYLMCSHATLSTAYSIAFNYDSSLLAIAHSASPYVTIYNTSDWSKVANPSTLPVGIGNGVSFNHDGSLLTVAHYTSPYITIYNTSDWSKVANPSTLPTGVAFGAAFNHDSSLMAVAHTSSPFVTIYNTSDWSKVANPSALPTGLGLGAAFNHDGSLLAIAHSASPYVTIYNTSDWSKVANPSTLPTGTGYGAAFNDDSSLLAVAHDTSPFVTIYNTSDWSKVANPSTLPVGIGNGAAFNHDGSLLAIAHSASPYVTIYNTSDWSKVANPSTLPTGFGRGATFNHDGSLLTVAHSTFPFVTIYNTSDWSKVANPSTLLAGVYYSPIFDTGAVADDYYMYLEADIAVTGAGTLWDDAIPDPDIWTTINITTKSWNEIFSVDEAPKVNISILYKVLIGDGWSEMKNAEILSAVVNARYFQIKIEIEDPANQINALVEHFTLRLYTET